MLSAVTIAILILAKGRGVRCGNGHLFCSKGRVATVAIVISIWQKTVVAAVAMAILVVAEDEWLGCADAWGRAW